MRAIESHYRRGYRGTLNLVTATPHVSFVTHARRVTVDSVKLAQGGLVAAPGLVRLTVGVSLPPVVASVATVATLVRRQL